jgi:hypothetical protein
LALSDVNPNIHPHATYIQRHPSYRASPQSQDPQTVYQAPLVPSQNLQEAYLPVVLTNQESLVNISIPTMLNELDLSSPIVPVQVSNVEGKNVIPQQLISIVQPIPFVDQPDVTTPPDSFSIQLDTVSKQNVLPVADATPADDLVTISVTEPPVVTSTEAQKEFSFLHDVIISSSIEPDVTNEATEPLNSLVSTPDTTPVTKDITELALVVESHNALDSWSRPTTSSTNQGDWSDNTTLVDNYSITNTESDKNASLFGKASESVTEPVNMTSETPVDRGTEPSLSTSTLVDIATTSSIAGQGDFAPVTSETSTEAPPDITTNANNRPTGNDQTIDATNISQGSSTTIQDDSISTLITEATAQSAGESSLVTELLIDRTSSTVAEVGQETILATVITDTPLTSDQAIFADSPIADQAISDDDALLITQTTEKVILSTDRSVTSSELSNSATAPLTNIDPSTEPDASAFALDDSIVAENDSLTITEQISQSTSWSDEPTAETSTSDIQATTTAGSIDVSSSQLTTFEVSIDSTTSQALIERLKSDSAATEAEAVVTSTDAVSQSTNGLDSASTANA